MDVKFIYTLITVKIMKINKKIISTSAIIFMIAMLVFPNSSIFAASRIFDSNSSSLKSSIQSMKAEMKAEFESMREKMKKDFGTADSSMAETANTATDAENSTASDTSEEYNQEVQDRVSNQTTTADSTCPQCSNGSPSGILSSDTANTYLRLNTDENATCKYSTQRGVDYYEMENSFSSTGGTSHSCYLPDLIRGNSYSYYVKCMDGNGNITENDYPINFRVGLYGDTTPPSTPENLNVTATSPNQTNLSWSNCTDNDAGVGGYMVYRDGNQLDSTTNNYYTDQSIAPNTTYNYSVVAYDNAGNNSSQCQPVSVSTPAATVEPTNSTASTTPEFVDNSDQTTVSTTTPSQTESPAESTFLDTSGTDQSWYGPITNAYSYINNGLYGSNNLYNWGTSGRNTNYDYSYENTNRLPYNEYRISTRSRLLRDRTTGDIYYVYSSGNKKWLPNRTVFDSYANNRMSDVVDVDSAVINTYPDLELVRSEDSSSVYRIEGNTRRLVSQETFTRNRYRSDEVGVVSQTDLNFYVDGSPIE